MIDGDDSMKDEHLLLAEIHDRSRKLLADVTGMMDDEQPDEAVYDDDIGAPGTSDLRHIRSLPSPRRPKYPPSLLCPLDTSVLRTLAQLHPHRLVVDVAATESRRTRVGFAAHGIYAAQSLVEYDNMMAGGFAPAAMRLAQKMYRCGVVDVRQQCVGRSSAHAQLNRSLMDINRHQLKKQCYACKRGCVDCTLHSHDY